MVGKRVWFMPSRLDRDKEKVVVVMNDRGCIKKQPSWSFSLFLNILVPAPVYDTVRISYNNSDAIIKRILGM